MMPFSKAKKKFVRVVGRYAPRDNFISGSFVTILCTITGYAFCVRENTVQLVLPEGVYAPFESIGFCLMVAAVAIASLMAYAQTNKGTVYPWNALYSDNDVNTTVVDATEDVAAAPSVTETADPPKGKVSQASVTGGSEEDTVSQSPPHQAAPDASGHRDQGRGSDRSRQPFGTGNRPQPTTGPSATAPESAKTKLPEQEQSGNTPVKGADGALQTVGLELPTRV